MSEKLNQHYVGLENLSSDMQRRVRDGNSDEIIIETGKSFKMGGEIFRVKDRTIQLFDANQSEGQGCILHGAILQGETAKIVSVQAGSKGAARYAFGVIYDIPTLKTKYAPRVEEGNHANITVTEVD